MRQASLRRRLLKPAASTAEVVGEAADGAAVISLVRRLRPDVVAMDVRMPLMDGLEATRAVLRTVDEPTAPIIETVAPARAAAIAWLAPLPPGTVRNSRRRSWW